MFVRRNKRDLTIISQGPSSPTEAFPSPPIVRSPRPIPGAGGSRGVVHLNHHLGISASGKASFDYPHETLQIRPRAIVKMEWFSELAGGKHEYIILKVSDKVYRKDVWVRFKPYLDDNCGDFAYRDEGIVPANTNLRASLAFPNQISYEGVIKLRCKMRKLFQARKVEANPYAQTSRFVEMLSATVGQGVGECTPEDLFEIWATRPDSDRHLRAFYWYLDNDSGLDYIILHVVATLDFKTDQRWWVRLERDEGTDKVYISRSRDLILLKNSELTSQMTFQDGIPFEDVRDILQAPPVAGPAVADSWDYASQLAFNLSVNVGNGLGDCPTKDLCQMWSGDYGRNVSINRAQCYREDGEDEAEYMLLNVSERSQGWDRRGLWLRLEQNATSGTNLDWTSISQNRRRLLGRGTSLVADMAFDELTFGEVRTIINRGQSNSFQGKIPSHSSMAEMLSSFSSLSCSAKSMQAMTPVITSTMPMSEVITHLVAHGCENISNTLNVPRCGSLPVSRGGFGEVYKGYQRSGKLVALKCVKISVDWGDEEDQKTLKNAARELYAWSKCSPHENIAPLLGLAVFRNQLAMISPWMDNGTLNNLDKVNMNVDRCRLSAQVCRGLAHLHLQNIVHGDMKGANILLSNNGTAMITDFGNTVLGECALRFTQASSKPHFSSRWAAPEVLENEVQCSKEADVFALGMTMLEIISGRPPYANIKGDAAVIYAIVDKKEIPKRPTRIPSESKKGDILWSLLQECWAFNPRNRPGAAKVEEVMRNIKQSDLA